MSEEDKKRVPLSVENIEELERVLIEEFGYDARTVYGRGVDPNLSDLLSEL
jgi:hypothetical protein